MQDQLKPKYGLITAITMVVGSVVGVGIFLRAPKMALSAGGDTTAVMLAWIVAALMIIPIAIIISEIASMVNRSGGMQVYAEETYGKRYGFTTGWAQSFFYIPGNLVFMLYLTADYTLQVFDLAHLGLQGIICLGAFYAIGLFVINILSAKVGGYIQVIATFIKVIPLVVIGVLGSLYFEGQLTTLGGDVAKHEIFNANFNLPTYIKIAAIIPAALFAFDGWSFVGVIAKEIKNPGRNIPLAIVGGLLSITVLYVLFTYASFNIADSKALATGGITNKEIGSLLVGNFFGNILDIFILISALGVANANTLTIIRAPYSLAQSRSFFGSSLLAKLNKNNMPVNSGILSLLVVLLYWFIPYFLGIAAGGDIYGLFIDSSLLLFFVMFAIICFGVVRMRTTHPDLERPFKVPFIKLFMTFATIGAGFGVYGLSVAYLNNLAVVVIFILLACSGSIVYSFTKEND